MMARAQSAAGQRVAIKAHPAAVARMPAFISSLASSVLLYPIAAPGREVVVIRSCSGTVLTQFGGAPQTTGGVANMPRRRRHAPGTSASGAARRDSRVLGGVLRVGRLAA